MKIYLNTTSIRILIARKNRNLTWFAKKVGVSRGYVSVLLAQKKSPRSKLRRRMQKVLNGHRWDDLFVISSTTTKEVNSEM